MATTTTTTTTEGFTVLISGIEGSKNLTHVLLDSKGNYVRSNVVLYDSSDNNNENESDIDAAVRKITLDGINSHQIASGCSVSKLEEQINITKELLGESVYRTVSSRAVLGYGKQSGNYDSIYSAINDTLIGCPHCGGDKQEIEYKCGR